MITANIILYNIIGHSIFFDFWSRLKIFYPHTYPFAVRYKQNRAEQKQRKLPWKNLKDESQVLNPLDWTLITFMKRFSNAEESKTK